MRSKEERKNNSKQQLQEYNDFITKYKKGPCRLNPRAISDYFGYRYVLDGKSFFSDIESLTFVTDSEIIGAIQISDISKIFYLNENYEPIEILGDSIVNCCIVWYLSRRFPQLNCQDGVKIIARLKIDM